MDGIWKLAGEVSLGKKGEIWAVALDSEGDHLVGTTNDGKNHVWELTKGDVVEAKEFAEYETRGGFGLAVDVVSLSILFFCSSTIDWIWCIPRIQADVSRVETSHDQYFTSSPATMCSRLRDEQLSTLISRNAKGHLGITVSHHHNILPPHQHLLSRSHTLTQSCI